jgi:hypothetical protein
MLNRLLALLVLIFTAASDAEAGRSHALRGLFCNSRADLEATLDRLGDVKLLATAVAITNRDAIVCTFAYAIKYKVIHPVMIARRNHDGGILPLYEADLIGVLVGNNARPVEPSLKIYFVSMDPVPDAATEDRT